MGNMHFQDLLISWQALKMTLAVIPGICLVVWAGSVGWSGKRASLRDLWTIWRETDRAKHEGLKEFAPVACEVFEFEVSGLKVVQSWLKYRMKKGAGKKSSPLDDIRPTNWTSQFTTELLELLWVLEATVEDYPEQAKLLKAFIDGECFTADELPQVREEMRKPPAACKPGADLFDTIEPD